MIRAPLETPAATADGDEATRIAVAMAEQLNARKIELGDERACIMCLHADWHWRTIDTHLDAAVERARALRAGASPTL